jgi:translation elongation factor EF-G
MNDVLEGKKPMSIDHQESHPQATSSPRSSSRSSAALLTRTKAFSLLLIAVIDYLPSPLDIPGEKGMLNGNLCLAGSPITPRSWLSPSRSRPTRSLAVWPYVRVYQGVFKSRLLCLK